VYLFENIQIFRDDNQFKKLIEDKNQFVLSRSNELSFTPLVANRRRKNKIKCRVKLCLMNLSAAHLQILELTHISQSLTLCVLK
jgi:hypothetical protein